MEAFLVEGGQRLEGTLRVDAAKNAVLPILAASILTEEEVVIRDCPGLRDVQAMISMLRMLGCQCEMQAGGVSIRSSASLFSAVLFLPYTPASFSWNQERL